MRAKKQRSRERGAALIITVIVIMVLMTLGLAMVAFTTTEERTATTYRDGMQAREVAQAGINIVTEMFRNPVNRNLVPLFSTNSADCTAHNADYCGTDEATTEASLNTIGIWRADRTPIAPARYTGINNRFFLGPFSDAWGQTFGGTHSPTPASDIYDLSFECRNVAVTACWLETNFNSLLQASSDFNLNTGKITKINFYAPPTANGIQYGICTVRVTAVKTDTNGAVLARETLEAVIGDLTPKPAVLGNGDVTLDVSGGTLCGDGCEAVHANGNVTVGNVASGSGQNPVVTATGSVTGQSSPTGAGGKAIIKSPKINPWDLAYKPTNATDLLNYYLVTARPLDPVWRGGGGTHPLPRPCGVSSLSLCQDYNLEYDTSGNPKAARSAADTPYMYRWNSATSDWTQCASGTTLNTCAGGPSFTVTTANDLIVAGTGDDADIPYNTTRVPQTVFHITNPANGCTVLIDGQFDKSGSGGWQVSMAIITVGSQSYSASTTWYPPSATNLIMWISGRDITSNSNCCAPSNQCATNLGNLAAQGIIAAHEQIYMHAQVALAGIIIAENKVNWDTTVNSSTQAINIDRGDHCYTCGRPDWPWSLPVTPAVISLKSVAE